MRDHKHIEGRDAINQEIKPGDFIVYGAAKGRCAGLNFGRVDAIVGKVKPRWDGDRPTVNLKVTAVEIAWQGYRKITRQSTLMFTDRVCVIPSIPDEFKQYFQ